MNIIKRLPQIILIAIFLSSCRTSINKDSPTENLENNINEIDLEGVNSPLRGSFKLSFGGNLKNYYQLYI